MNRKMKSLISTLLMGGTLMFALSPAASAHETGYLPYVANDYYHAGPPQRAYPRWLRRDRDFHRWYLRSRYRDAHELSWHRLYTLYRHDLRYNRHPRHYYPYRQWNKSDSKRRYIRRYRSGD